MNLFELAHHPCLQVSASPTLPTIWLWRRLKTLCRFEYGDAMPADARASGTVVVMGSNGPIGHHSVANTVGRTIVVGRKGSFGKVRVSSDPVWVMDTAYFIQERDCSADFDWLAHILRWLPLDEVSTDSAVPGLDRVDAMNSLVPVPPASGQAAIVKYLRHAHARINRAIGAKRKLIALLDEQKQAVIHQAVTRGLDPNARLKDSGIPWLGQVPAHWRVQRLGALIADGPKNGISPLASGEPDAVKSLSLSAVHDGAVDIGAEHVKYVSNDHVGASRDYSLLRGDILMIRGSGSGHRVGQVGLVESDFPGFIYPDLLMRIRLTSQAAPEYVVRVLRDSGSRAQFEEASRTAVGTLKISGADVRGVRVALPPLREQEEICVRLEASTKGLAQAADRTGREIALLQEFRTRLTSDVVTGQVDVRQVAASLPDLTDDQLGGVDESTDPVDDAAEYLDERAK